MFVGFRRAGPLCGFKYGSGWQANQIVCIIDIPFRDGHTIVEEIKLVRGNNRAIADRFNGQDMMKIGPVFRYSFSGGSAAGGEDITRGTIGAQVVGTDWPSLKLAFVQDLLDMLGITSGHLRSLRL